MRRSFAGFSLLPLLLLSLSGCNAIGDKAASLSVIYGATAFLSLLLLIVSLLFFIPVLMEYFATGLVPRFPTLIVSMGLFMFALLALVCGFVLDTVAKKHRQLFEINLNILSMLHKGENR